MAGLLETVPALEAPSWPPRHLIGEMAPQSKGKGGRAVGSLCIAGVDQIVGKASGEPGVGAEWVLRTLASQKCWKDLEPSVVEADGTVRFDSDPPVTHGPSRLQPLKGMKMEEDEVRPHPTFKPVTLRGFGARWTNLLRGHKRRICPSGTASVPKWPLNG